MQKCTNSNNKKEANNRENELRQKVSERKRNEENEREREREYSAVE